MPNKVIKEEAKTEILRRLEDYMRMMHLTMSDPQNAIYAEFLASVRALSSLTGELYTEDEEEKYPKLTEEKLNQLIEAYQNVSKDAQTIMRDETVSPVADIGRNIANEINDIVSLDVAKLLTLDTEKLTTLPELIEGTHTLNTDLGYRKQKENVLTKIKHDFSKELLKEVKAATLFARGSEEFKMMSDKLVEISEMELPSQYSAYGMDELKAKYTELAKWAKMYLDKKSLETNISSNGQKRIAVAKRVLEHAASFDPQSSPFVLDDEGNVSEIDEKSNEYMDIRLRKAYNLIKQKFPDVKIDIKKAQELMDDNEGQISMVNAMGIETTRQEALQYRDMAGLTGGDYRGFEYIFWNKTNKEAQHLAEIIKAKGTRGFEGRKAIAEELFDKIVAVNEEMFANVNDPDACVELMREHGPELKLIYDKASADEIFRQFNFEPTDVQRMQLDRQYAKFKNIISAVNSQVSCQADPVRFLTDPRVMKPEELNAMRSSVSFALTEFLGYFSDLNKTPRLSDRGQRSIDLGNKLSQLQAFGKPYIELDYINHKGEKADRKEMTDAIDSGKVIGIFEPRANTGRIVYGVNKDGTLKTMEGGRFEMYKCEALNLLERLEKTTPGKIGDSKQLKDLAASLRELCEEGGFNFRKAQEVAQKAEDYIVAKQGQKVNERRGQRLAIARSLKRLFREPEFEKANLEKREFKVGKEEAIKRTKACQDLAVERRKDQHRIVNLNKTIAKFEDSVLKQRDPETKRLGLMAAEAKRKLIGFAKEDVLNFTNDEKTTIFKCIAVTLAYQERKVSGENARELKDFTQDRSLLRAVKNMDGASIKEYIETNQEIELIENNHKAELTQQKNRIYNRPTLEH